MNEGLYFFTFTIHEHLLLANLLPNLLPTFWLLSITFYFQVNTNIFVKHYLSLKDTQPMNFYGKTNNPWSLSTVVQLKPCMLGTIIIVTPWAPRVYSSWLNPESSGQTNCLPARKNFNTVLKDTDLTHVYTHRHTYCCAVIGEARITQKI